MAEPPVLVDIVTPHDVVLGDMDAPPAPAPAPAPNTASPCKSSASSSSSSSSMLDLPQLRPHHQAPGMAQKQIVAGADRGASTSGTSKEQLRANLTAAFLVLSYIAAGILFYHFQEGWPVVDAVYFCMIIVTTIGYGDVVPLQSGSRVFTIFFAFYGICTIGMALGRLASWFLFRQQQIAKQTAKRLLETVDQAADSAAMAMAAPSSSDSKQARARAKAAAAAAAVGVQRARKHRKMPTWVRIVFSRSNYAIFKALIPIACSIGGGLIVGAIEGWSVLDCFYYSIITVTTIGFGDLSPKSEAARIYAIFYLPLSVIALAHGIGSVLEEIGKRRVMKSSISMKELLDMDANGDGKVSQLEYVSYMLVKLGKVDQGDIDGILEQFHKLDRDGSGELDKNDLERIDRQLQRGKERSDA